MKLFTRPRAPPPEPAKPLCFETAARSHPGCARAVNEDAFLALPQIGLWAISDGMGGHQAGDVASALVVEALARARAHATPFAFLQEVSQAVLDAHQDLRARAQGEGHAGMGATLVALLAQEGHYACVWAGDSRAYRLRQGKLTQVTHDHSLVQELIDAGLLNEDMAKSHPRANVVTRAVGMDGALILDRRHAPLEEKDTFMLCSDGLTRLVSDAEIQAAMRNSDLEAACDVLLDQALARGAPDNVTLILVRARKQGARAAS